MSGRSIKDLADTIREQLGEDWFAAMAVVEHLVAGGRKGFDPYELPDPVRRLVYAWTPGRVQAEVDMKRALLTRLLAEPHGLVDDGDGGSYPCPRRGTSAACGCGRDELVRGCLEIMASVDELRAAG